MWESMSNIYVNVSDPMFAVITHLVYYTINGTVLNARIRSQACSWKGILNLTHNSGHYEPV